ncbi:MAG TPA: alpha/beta hydrolase [Burkholderiaceae bacterium]|nr:alpha/beta hydrolase [Burkholderiaceae bacterium]
MPLDADIARIIPLMPLQDVPNMTPVNARESMRALAAARNDIPLPDPGSVNDTTLPGPAGDIPVRVYRTRRAPAPTVVYYHGGGWVAGDLDTHDRAARTLAIELDCTVVSVHYRRPPEAPFPAAFDDALAAARQVAARQSEFGGAGQPLVVAGDSAGGNLAAAVALAARDGSLKLAAQLLIYPVTDVVGHYRNPHANHRFPSRQQNASGYFLSMAVMQWFADHYLPEPGQAHDPRVSPLQAASLAGLPPTVLCTAQYDPLRDEGQAYAQALRAAGVRVIEHHGAGLIHGYFGMGAASAAAAEESRRVRADLRMLIESPGASS